MKITYLEHSGYMAEVEGRILVFDYYKGTLPKLPEKAKIYVFASHVHSDHFNKQIFDWQGRYTDIHYILSDDIKADAPEGRCTLIGPCREITLDGMEIRTLKSTESSVRERISSSRHQFLRISLFGDQRILMWPRAQRFSPRPMALFGTSSLADSMPPRRAILQL